MKNNAISEATIKRLPIYLRYLNRLKISSVEKVSSREIGENLNFNPSQVRKDLSFFGDFGKRGYGYDVVILVRRIEEILNLDHHIPVCLVGAGKLGQALSNYNHYLEEHMKIEAIFDQNPKKIGEMIDDLTIQPDDEIIETIHNKKIKVGIICVPEDNAQHVTNLLVKAGIKAILNFAPIIVKTPEDVKVNYADFTSELHTLAYFLDKP